MEKSRSSSSRRSSGRLRLRSRRRAVSRAASERRQQRGRLFRGDLRCGLSEQREILRQHQPGRLRAGGAKTRFPQRTVIIEKTGVGAADEAGVRFAQLLLDAAEPVLV